MSSARRHRVRGRNLVGFPARPSPSPACPRAPKYPWWSRSTASSACRFALPPHTPQQPCTHHPQTIHQKPATSNQQPLPPQLIPVQPARRAGRGSARVQPPLRSLARPSQHQTPLKTRKHQSPTTPTSPPSAPEPVHSSARLAKDDFPPPLFDFPAAGVLLDIAFQFSIWRVSRAASPPRFPALSHR